MPLLTGHFYVIEISMRGVRVEDPEELQDTLRNALSFPGPLLVDIISQPLQDARAPVSKWVA